MHGGITFHPFSHYIVRYQGDLKYAILALKSNSYFCYSRLKNVLRIPEKTKVPQVCESSKLPCISKTTDFRDLRPSLNDSEGPILGGSSERHFSPTSTVFAVIANFDHEKREQGGLVEEATRCSATLSKAKRYLLSRPRPSQRQNVTYYQDQDPLKGKTLPIIKTKTLSKAKRYLLSRPRPSQRQNVTYYQDQDPLKGKTLPIIKTKTLSKAKRYLKDQDPLKCSRHSNHESLSLPGERKGLSAIVTT
eukprot:sb/3468807/